MPHPRPLLDDLYASAGRGLISLLAAGCLAGCNWTPTTMALEPPATTRATTRATSSATTALTTAATTAATAPVQPAAVVPGPGQPAPPAVEPATAEDGRLKARLTQVAPDQLVGTWRDRFYGTRTLTLNADGTARMVLDLDFAGRLMYGSRLDFDMKWSVDGATVSIEILSGRPAKTAKSMMESWGCRYEYLLDCVEDRQIEMRAWDGSANYTLRRLTEE